MEPLTDSSRIRSDWHRFRRYVRADVTGFWLLMLLILWIAGIITGYQRPEQEADGEEFHPAAQNSALLSWDRIYRLNAATEHQSEWVRWLMRHEASEDLLEQAREELHQLWLEQSLDRRGCTTLAVMENFSREKKTVQGKREAEPSDDEVEEELPAFDVEPFVKSALKQKRWSERVWQQWEQRFQGGDVFWWEVEYVERRAKAQGVTLLDDEIALQRQRNDRLLENSYWASVGNVCLLVAGMFSLPWGLRRMAGGWKSRQCERRVRYVNRISLSLIILLLLAFDFSNNLLFELLRTMLGAWEHNVWCVMVQDTLWRALPTLLMLWFLFRKPKWMVRSFGLDHRPQWSVILSLYALLLVLDFFLLGLMSWMESGVSSYELDPMEQGWTGLIYGLVSACVMAPVMEEFIYRGFLFQGLLRKTGFFVAVLLSSMVFAVSHFYDLYGTISVGLCGMATAYAYVTTRSLLNAILLHAVYNLSITIPGWVLFHAPL
jgi:membrane protease YdiL (CAAX protease family)